jgi:Xaa-Pro dipeptidase
MAIFSTAEIEGRHEKLRPHLGVSDVVVAFSFFNSYYLSGVPIIPWGRPAITVVPKDSPPAMILATIEHERASQHSPITEFHTYSDIDGPNASSSIRLLSELLKSRGLRRIAFDAKGTSVAMLEMLKAAMPGAQFADISDELEQMQLVNSDEELALIRSATEIADMGIKTFINEAKIGVAEVVLAGRAMLAMSEYAARHFPDIETKVNCYSQQGTRSLQAHTGASGDTLRERELMALVIEVYAWNYQVAVERALVVGTPPDEQRRYYETMLEAQTSAIEAIRPGVSFATVDRAARQVFQAAGYDQIHCGTGLVRGLITEWQGRVDRGNIRPYNENLLLPNMVLSVEPWAIAPGVGAPRHCDMVLVTENGHEIISKRPEGIISVG